MRDQRTPCAARFTPIVNVTGARIVELPPSLNRAAPVRLTRTAPPCAAPARIGRPGTRPTGRLARPRPPGPRAPGRPPCTGTLCHPLAVLPHRQLATTASTIYP